MNPWLEHVKKYREAHPRQSYKEVLTHAKATYTPVKKTAPKKKMKGAGPCQSKQQKPGDVDDFVLATQRLDFIMNQIAEQMIVIEQLPNESVTLFTRRRIQMKTVIKNNLKKRIEKLEKKINKIKSDKKDCNRLFKMIELTKKQTKMMTDFAKTKNISIAEKGFVKVLPSPRTNKKIDTLDVKNEKMRTALKIKLANFESNKDITDDQKDAIRKQLSTKRHIINTLTARINSSASTTDTPQDIANKTKLNSAIKAQLNLLRKLITLAKKKNKQDEPDEQKGEGTEENALSIAIDIFLDFAKTGKLPSPRKLINTAFKNSIGAATGLNITPDQAIEASKNTVKATGKHLKALFSGNYNIKQTHLLSDVAKAEKFLIKNSFVGGLPVIGSTIDKLLDIAITDSSQWEQGVRIFDALPQAERQRLFDKTEQGKRIIREKKRKLKEIKDEKVNRKREKAGEISRTAGHITEQSGNLPTAAKRKRTIRQIKKIVDSRPLTLKQLRAKKRKTPADKERMRQLVELSQLR